MSQVIGTGAAVGVIGLLVTVLLLIVSIFNPAVAVAIDSGQDPITVIAVYGSFWSDLFFLLASIALWGTKSFLYGIFTLQNIPNLLETLLSGNILAFLGAFKPWLDYLASVTGYLWELVQCFFFRLGNVITPGRIPTLLENLVAW